MNQQILNNRTGEFIIDNDFVISNKTKSEELLARFEVIHLVDFQNGQSNYTVRNLKIATWYFILTFYFFNKSITKVGFVVQAEPYNDSDGWENFNVDSEIKKGKYMESWMANQMKNNFGIYDWGQAGVNYDFHNLSYTCFVNYAPLPD